MKTLMGLINLEHEHHYLHELTYFRNGASIPFAGRYRMIDFTLSNMTNSNIKEVAVFARNKYRSLMDHLGTGEHWELDRRNGGLFILPPDWNDPSDISKGDLQFFHNNRDYFKRGKSSYVLISGSQFISNTDYKKAFDFHLDRGADVTLISTTAETPLPEHGSYYRIASDDAGWVQGITNDKSNPQLFTGVYIINKDVLMDIVDHCIAHYKGNFFADGIIGNLSKLNVQTYQNDGYSAFINSIESFYRHNMNLLTEENYRQLFYKKPFIRTKVSNHPPVKYRDKAFVSNSIIADGGVINGDVDSSILFRGVTVEEGATIKDSIIMQRCTIEAGVHLENVILDKDVHVTANQKLIGSKKKPYVVAKRQVVTN
ncbi:glucose-1-phosphate adenylyltransferase subunit GlgD [Virgibacillus profundi]|uniref:Glucose-1-phosphate adenylyltransferase subunit GlgD n=1 Tax=Virgibacillus profundi TaxID=2024555 RepID=A0A2A2II64_9BACI|nr:glucose-1-phosphate adenylyltransferase subunit GlgD [Virgibacillus profundi]PAV30793.1 glucose-1-phosphate adenylyltransferase subunit GlgD [Virgibacillus profundi]PXY54976.1 glucose-1-phosphate adenylyltransferase subunit GlgD [Virgibacillus profundi]